MILCLLGSPLLAYATIYLFGMLGFHPGARSGEGLIALPIIAVFALVVGVGLWTRRTAGEVALVLGASIATTIGGGFVLLLILISSYDMN